MSLKGIFLDYIRTSSEKVDQDRVVPSCHICRLISCPLRPCSVRSGLRGIGGDLIPFYTNLYMREFNPPQSTSNRSLMWAVPLFRQQILLNCRHRHGSILGHNKTSPHLSLLASADLHGRTVPCSGIAMLVVEGGHHLSHCCHGGGQLRSRPNHALWRPPPCYNTVRVLGQSMCVYLYTPLCNGLGPTLGLYMHSQP
jgi:hypothetical protein